MQYYVFGPDGQRYGPATIEDLNAWMGEGRINATTMVEDIASGARLAVSSLPGIVSATASVPPMGSRAAGAPPTSGYYPRPEKVDNNLAKAIFTALCCCLPLGIVSIVYAAKVDGFASSGNVAEARMNAQKADTWANWGIGLGLVWGVLYLILMIASGGGRSF